MDNPEELSKLELLVCARLQKNYLLKYYRKVASLEIQALEQKCVENTENVSCLDEVKSLQNKLKELDMARRRSNLELEKKMEVLKSNVESEKNKIKAMEKLMKSPLYNVLSDL